MTKSEQIQKRIEKAEERLNRKTDEVKVIKKEIARLLKEKEEAELCELQSYMKTYNISASRAKLIISSLQQSEEKERSEAK